MTDDRAIAGPVFLVGCPRSGTTLLQRMLDAHPEVAVAPETFFIRNLWRRRKEFDPDWERGGRARLVDLLAQTPELQEMGLDRDAIDEESRSVDWLSALFTALLRRFARDRGASVVGEKTPNHLLYMRTLERLFPACRFVHIVRDPRAVVDSWSRVPWSNGSVRADAEVWRKYMAAARERPPRDRDRLVSLRYERLVAEPEAELKRICDFLDIAYDERMLRYHELEADTVNAEREPWKENALAPVSADSVDAWKDRMDPTAVRDTEAVVWFEMLRLRYPPVGHPVLAWPRASLAAASRAMRRRTRKKRGKASGKKSR